MSVITLSTTDVRFLPRLICQIVWYVTVFIVVLFSLWVACDIHFSFCDVFKWCRFFNLIQILHWDFVSNVPNIRKVCSSRSVSFTHSKLFLSMHLWKRLVEISLKNNVQHYHSLSQKFKKKHTFSGLIDDFYSYSS